MIQHRRETEHSLNKDQGEETMIHKWGTLGLLQKAETPGQEVNFRNNTKEDETLKLKQEVAIKA